MMTGIYTDWMYQSWARLCFHTWINPEHLGATDLQICGIIFLKDAVGLRPKNEGAAGFKSTTTESFVVADVSRLCKSSLNFN